MTAAHDGLERRYRRLLRAYPAAHRSIYAEEMITVLISGAAPEQRRPDPREALGLVAGGFGARLRAPLRAARGPEWSGATGVFGYVTCVLLAAVYAYQVAGWLAWRGILVGQGTPHAAMALVPVWAVAAVAAARSWRRIAAATATAGAAGVVVAFARAYRGGPGAVVAYWWLVVLAVAAAVSLGLLARPARPGRRPVWAVAVAAALISGAALAEPLTLRITRFGQGEFAAVPRLPQLGIVPIVGTRPLLAVAMLVLLATLGALLHRLPPATRRRVVLLATPAAAAGLVVAVMTLQPFDLLAAEWVGLVGVPLLALGVGTTLLARYERRSTDDRSITP